MSWCRENRKRSKSEYIRNPYCRILMGLDLQAASNIKQTSGEFHRFHRWTPSFYLLLLESWNRCFHTEQERITDGTRVKMFGLFGHCKMMHDSSRWSHDASLKKTVEPLNWSILDSRAASEIRTGFALCISWLQRVDWIAAKFQSSSWKFKNLATDLGLSETMAHQHPLAITGLSWSSLSKLAKWGKPWKAPFWNITNPFVWHILILNFWRSYCSERLCTKAIPCCAEAQWGHLQRPASRWPC